MQVYGLKKTNTRNTLAKAMEESCVTLLVPLESTTATLDCVLGWPKSPFSFSTNERTHISFSPITLMIWMF